MELIDHFTQVHLWTDGFEFSVEAFMMKNNEQIGVGDSPGDSKYESGKVYVNPYPFNENTIDQSLSRQVVNICLEWNKVEWKELENNRTKNCL